MSSTNIGVTFAKIDQRIAFGDTLAIVPKPPTPKDLGYTTVTPRTIQSHGRRYKAFLREGEIVISQEEAARRLQALKSTTHNYLLRNIGQQCGKFLRAVRPDVVCIEKNKSFNGILTTKLLAEIAGGVYFYCGVDDIEICDWDEATVRAQIRRDITDFSLETDDGRKALDTKWEIHCRLRSYFEKECPGMFRFNKMTMDESDSLAVFYYWYTQRWKAGHYGTTPLE